MDIQLETLRYHLVIFWEDFFTIDFLTVNVIQNRYTSFASLCINWEKLQKANFQELLKPKE